METLLDALSSITQLVDSLAEMATDSPLTYLVVLALAGLDAVLPILPGESVVLVAAVLAGSGRLDLGTVILVAGVGAFLGDNLAYWIGRTAGRPLAMRLMRGRSEAFEWLDARFKERGGSFIVVGRFVPGGRTAVALGSGALRYPWSRYLAYDAAAASLWALQAALPGYLGGYLFADRPWLGLLIGFSLAIMLAGAIELVRRARGRPGGSPVGPAVARPSGALASGTDPAGGRGVPTTGAREDGRGHDDEADGGPGGQRGPDDAERADPEQVAQPRAEQLAREGTGPGGRQDGQDVPSRPPPDEEIGARVEGADEQRQDHARVEDELTQDLGHPSTDRLSRPSS